MTSVCTNPIMWVIIIIIIVIYLRYYFTIFSKDIASLQIFFSIPAMHWTVSLSLHKPNRSILISLNTYLRILSLTTSQSPKLIWKAVLKWEGPYFYCKHFFGAFWLTTKKSWKLDFPLYFQILSGRVQGFFSSCQSANFLSKRLVFTY